MLTTTLSIVGLLILGQICKRSIVPRYGDTGLHIFLFVVALAIVVVQVLMTTYPGFGQMILIAGKYLAGAIALYEVILKKITDTMI